MVLRVIEDYLDMISTSNTTVYNHCIRSLAFSFILIFSSRVTQSSKNHLLSVRYFCAFCINCLSFRWSSKYHGLRRNHLSIVLSLSFEVLFSSTNNVHEILSPLSLSVIFLPYINNVIGIQSTIYLY